MTTHSDYTPDELEREVSLDLTLGQTLALHGMASRQLRRERTRAEKRPFTPAPGKHNAAAEAIVRLDALVYRLADVLDHVDDALELASTNEQENR